MTLSIVTGFIIISAVCTYALHRVLSLAKEKPGR